MDKIIEWFDGKKSYIAGIALFIVGGLSAIGAISREQFETIAAIIGAFAIYGLRQAIRKIE